MKLADEGMSALFPEKNVLVTKCVERRPEVGKDCFRIGKPNSKKQSFISRPSCGTT